MYTYCMFHFKTIRPEKKVPSLSQSLKHQTSPPPLALTRTIPKIITIIIKKGDAKAYNSYIHLKNIIIQPCYKRLKKIWIAVK